MVTCHQAESQSLNLKHGTAEPRNYTELHVTKLNAPHCIYVLSQARLQSCMVLGHAGMHVKILPLGACTCRMKLSPP